MSYSKVNNWSIMILGQICYHSQTNTVQKRVATFQMN